jgi:biotin carboxyl carrier protein
MALLDVRAEVTGAVWKIMAVPGQKISAGDTLLVMESMKMEIPVLAPEDGILRKILVEEEDVVNEGDVVVSMEEH